MPEREALANDARGKPPHGTSAVGSERPTFMYVTHLTILSRRVGRRNGALRRNDEGTSARVPHAPQDSDRVVLHICAQTLLSIEEFAERGLPDTPRSTEARARDLASTQHGPNGRRRQPEVRRDFVNVEQLGETHGFTPTSRGAGVAEGRAVAWVGGQAPRCT